jgi:hypothetical protein
MYTRSFTYARHTLHTNELEFFYIGKLAHGDDNMRTIAISSYDF